MYLVIDDKKLAMLVIGMLLFTLSVVMNPVQAPPVDNFAVDFVVSHESPWRVCFDDYIMNLQDINDDFPYKAILNETSIDLSKVTVDFYEWKPEDINVTDYAEECNPYNITENETTYEIPNCTKVESGSHIETRWDWLERNLVDSTEDGSALRTQWEEVTIKKYDTKRFRRCYNFNERTYGSYGYTYLDVKGEEFYDFSDSSWWDTATYEYAYEVHSTAKVAGMPISVNDTNGTGSNNVIIWTNNETTDQQWLVCTGAGVTGTCAVGNTTDEANWENETNMTGNNPQSVWDANYEVVLHSHNISMNDSTSNNVQFAIAGDPQDIAGVFGGAVDFDGTGDYYTFGELGIFDGDFTIEFWVNFNADERTIFLTFLDEKAIYFQYDYENPDADKLDFFWYESTAVQHLESTDTLAHNAWHYVVAVVNKTNTNAFLYINGTLQGSDLTVGTIDAASAATQLGANAGGSEIDGQIDEFRISNIGRSELYIDANWQNGQDALMTLGAEELPAPPGPLYSNNFTAPVTPQVWTGTKEYGFQIDWENANNVSFKSDFNGTSGTYSYSSGHIKNTSTTTYWINFTDENMTVAAHDYQWYATNVSNTNNTEAVVYTTTQADPEPNMALTLDGSATTPQTRTYPNATNIQGSETNILDDDCARVTLWNGTNVGNGAITLPARTHNLTYAVSGCTNYTIGQLERMLEVTVNATVVSVDLFLNGTQNADKTMLNGTSINITATTSDSAYKVFVDSNLTTWDEIYDEIGTYENVTVYNITPVPKTYNITAYTNPINYTSDLKTYYLTLDDVEIDAESYNTDVLENSSQTISIVFDYPSAADDLYGTLIWNNTVYANDSVTMNGTHITLAKTLSMPAIWNDSVTKTFFWNFTYDGHEHINRTSTPHTQIIYRPRITQCDDTYGTYSTTISFHDENSTDFPLVNATAELYLEFDVSGSAYTYNVSFTNNSIDLCIFPAWNNFTVDGELTYTNASYTYRIYTFDNDVFDNTTEQMDMLLIDAVLAPKLVKISMKDEYGNAYPDVVVKAQRWYNSLGIYKTAAAPITDITGDAYTYLHLDDAEYRFLLYGNGVLLKTIPKMIIPNVAADDPIILEFMITFDEIIEWLIFKDRITGTCTYANVTGNLTCTYEDTSSTVKLSQVKLTVKRYTGALQSSVIYSETNTSVPTGSFIAHLGNETAQTSDYSYTMLGKLTINENEYFIIYSGFLDLDASTTKLFGNCRLAGNLARCREGVVITFLLTLLSALVGTMSPTVSILMMLTALGMSSAVGLWAISSQIIVGLGLMGALIIYRMRGEKGK